jgi:hypothetical protein
MPSLFRTNLGDEYINDERPQAVSPSKVRVFRQMKDSDPMPFGEHRGTPIGQVPASYLDHLRDANWLDRYPAVAEYIERNGKAIDKELDERGSWRSEDFIAPERDAELAVAREE